MGIITDEEYHGRGVSRMGSITDEEYHGRQFYRRYKWSTVPYHNYIAMKPNDEIYNGIFDGTELKIVCKIT